FGCFPVRRRSAPALFSTRHNQNGVIRYADHPAAQRLHTRALQCTQIVCISKEFLSLVIRYNRHDGRPTPTAAAPLPKLRDSPTAQRPKKDAIAPRAKFASGPPSSAASRGRPPNPYAAPI